MKKITALILSAALLLMSACGSSENPQPSVSDITKKILEEVEFSSAAEKSVDDLKHLIPVDTSTVSELSYYICGSGAYPDELAVIKFTDSKAAKASEPIAKERLDSQTETYKSYAPDEMYKLEGAVIKVKNEYLFYYATNNNDKATEIINSFFK